MTCLSVYVVHKAVTRMDVFCIAMEKHNNFVALALQIQTRYEIVDWLVGIPYVALSF